MHTQKPQNKPANHKRRRKISRNTWTVIRWLVFCFPAGLLMMWSDRCRWSRMAKCTVSTMVAALVALVVVPQTLPPARPKGGVEIVSQVPVAEALGPKQSIGPEGAYEVYLPDYVNPTTMIIEPTPSPTPVYVYCNNGGKKYHVKKCRYVKKGTGRVTLSQAIAAGYIRCPECDAPVE